MTRVLAAAVLALVASSLAAVPGAGAASGEPPPEARRTVTADGLPTVQVDGVVWTQVIVGDTLYAGGEFDSARPAGSAPGSGTVARRNLLAYDLRSGELVTQFRPVVNGPVRGLAASPDGTRLYAVGAFTRVDGQRASRVVALDPVDGSLVKGFRPRVDNEVRAVVASRDKVWIGGNFFSVDGKARTRLAAFRSDGTLLRWAPRATGGFVWALALSPDRRRVAVGGSFTRLQSDNRPGYGIGMVDSVTGKALPFRANRVVRNAGDHAAVTTLASDGTHLYGGGYVFGPGGNLEGTFSADWAKGRLRWVNPCHGDTYSVAPSGGVLYVASHSYNCGTLGAFPQTFPVRTNYRGTAFDTRPSGRALPDAFEGYHDFAGRPTSALLTWFPKFDVGSATGQLQGPWSVAATDDYVAMGGEFTMVNDLPQQGLVRFATSDLSPSARGPALAGPAYPLNVRAAGGDAVRITWLTNEDQDDRTLVYRLYRDTEAAENLIFTTTRSADFWDPHLLRFVDEVDPEQDPQYLVTVTDSDQNITRSPWTGVQGAATAGESPYVTRVLERADHLWRVGADVAGVVPDEAGFAPLRVQGGAHVAGAIADDADPGLELDGAGGDDAFSEGSLGAPLSFSMELWFRTSAPGSLLSFGAERSGSWRHVDRVLYVGRDGRLRFGVREAKRVAVAAAGDYRDGDWHHAVATLGPSGMRLYVDGTLAASRATPTTALVGYQGRWRLGGPRLSKWWPSSPQQPFGGAVDEVAVYRDVLTVGDVATHHALGTGTAGG